MQHHHSKRSASPQAHTTPLSDLLSLVWKSSDSSNWNKFQDAHQWNISCVEESRGLCEIYLLCDFMATYELIIDYTDRDSNQIAGVEASHLISK